jgi:hypothetical protein
VETGATLAEEEVGVAVIGSTIRNTAVALRIETGRPQIGSAARRVATRWRTVRLVLGSKSAARAAIWQVLGQVAGPTEKLARALGRVEAGSVEVAPTASAVAMFHAAVEGTVMRLEEVPEVREDTMGQVRGPVGAAEPRAWDREGEAADPVAAAAVAADGADEGSGSSTAYVRTPI